MDENAAGATITAVSTENATETTVDNDHFEVVDGNLKLKADSSLDFEAIEGGMLDVVITASGDGESATHTVTITVNDVNEAPMIAVADGETPDGMAASSTVDENVEGAILGAITLSDPDAGQMHTLTTSDERFVTKQDAEGGWWLALADGVSLDHEAGATVMVTVTVTDDGDPAMSASTDVTITVNDVNEAPEAGMQPTVTAEANVDLAAEIDLSALFTDPDDGDEIVRWELSGNPDWLKLTVQFGEDDGTQTVTGLLTGKPKAGDDSSHMVTITATDGDGESGSASFYVVVDDGNDEITAINLYHLNDDGTDGDKNFSYTVDVDENHAGEVNLGRVTVDDLDSPHHPHGQHQVIVTGGQAKNFEIKEDAEGGLWLVKKAGVEFDYEDTGSVSVTIQAADINGEKYPANHSDAAKRNQFKGESSTQTVTVLINDKDDDPVTNVEQGKAGWWVTVDADLEAEDVAGGQWLTFNLQTGDDDPNAAFKDEDANSGTPAYKIEVLNGPEFLEIGKTGQIKNKAKMLPPEAGGVFNVRVTAEYDDKSPVHFDFQLTVAFSDDDNEDNDAPEIENVSRNHYTEGDGAGVVVATFTVEDDDSHLTGHPFAPGMPTIVSVTNAEDPNANDPNNDGNYKSVFTIERGNSPNTYRIVTKDPLDPSAPKVDETAKYLDHELADELTITVMVSDGIDGSSDSVEIDIDIRDDAEAPEYVGEKQYEVEQFFEDEGTATKDQGKVAIWIKLFEVWEDEDDDSGSDDDELTYTAISNVPWIKILHGPAEWGDIADGPDGRQDGTDNVDWASGVGSPDDVPWGGDSPEETPDRDDWVVVVEIDRSAANNRQSDVTIDLGQGRTAGGGTFTLTATDEDGRKGTQEIKVHVQDENLPTDTAKAVTITGTPMEGRHLTANFDETKDPDLAGDASPALVVYTWSVEGQDRQVGISNRYTPIQDDVGKTITVSVTYYELVPPDAGTELPRGTLVLASEAQNGGSKSTTSVVSDAQNPGAWHISLLTNGTNDGLTAEVVSRDADGIDIDDSDPEGTAPVYTWENSVNGRGGWEAVDDADRTDLNLALADGKGEYYRLVVTYTDNGGFQERHVSDTIKVGKLDDAIPDSGANALGLVSSGQTQVGGILQVNNVPTGASVQWQVQRGGTTAPWSDIPGATGESLSITAHHAGGTLRAVVTSTDKDGNVVDIDIVTADNAIAPLPNTAPSKLKDHTIDAQVDDMGDSTQVHGTVDLSTLFEDLNGDRLTFEVTDFSPSGIRDLSTGTPTSGDSRNTEFVGGNADHVVSFKIDGSTGTLTYVTDLPGNHDGESDGDGQGNMVSFTVRANDGKTDEFERPTAMVNVRLNVKPSGIDEDEVSGGYTQAEKTFATNTLIATLNVQDENFSGSPTMPGHPYGIHTVTVSDDRFGIRHTTGTDPKKDGDGDGSTWELYIKKGATFDFDGAKDANPATPEEKEVQIKLTLTATDGGGKMVVAKDLITITITNVDDGGSDDPGQQPAAGDTVPGLSDNEDSDDNDETDGTDDGTTDDIDGGWTPPPPGMSIGLIEDFVDNMNGFDQDLLEDFMLIIDDGIDIA